MSDMSEMTYQQRREYIERCKAEVKAKRDAWIQATADHEMEVARIVAEGQVAMWRAHNKAMGDAYALMAKSHRITVAM